MQINGQVYPFMQKQILNLQQDQPVNGDDKSKPHSCLPALISFCL